MNDKCTKCGLSREDHEIPNLLAEQIHTKFQFEKLKECKINGGFSELINDNISVIEVAISTIKKSDNSFFDIVHELHEVPKKEIIKIVKRKVVVDKNEDKKEADIISKIIPLNKLFWLRNLNIDNEIELSNCTMNDASKLIFKLKKENPLLRYSFHEIYENIVSFLRLSDSLISNFNYSTDISKVDLMNNDVSIMNFKYRSYKILLDLGVHTLLDLKNLDLTSNKDFKKKSFAMLSIRIKKDLLNK